MTGIERLIQKTSNATSAAILGRGRVVVAVEPWRLEVARQEAIEDEEKRLRDKWRMRRRMVRYGCE
jgi:hypothetical protein